MISRYDIYSEGLATHIAPDGKTALLVLDGDLYTYDLEGGWVYTGGELPPGSVELLKDFPVGSRVYWFRLPEGLCEDAYYIQGSHPEFSDVGKCAARFDRGGQHMGYLKLDNSALLIAASQKYKVEDLKYPKEAPISSEEERSGGPAGYYDLPYQGWVTTNDMGEYLAKERWGAYSLHFKDSLKALVRFGAKGGTTQKYDIEKMIYSGCRAMIMLSGKKALRVYLQRLLDDPQFKE